MEVLMSVAVLMMMMVIVRVLVAVRVIVTVVVIVTVIMMLGMMMRIDVNTVHQNIELHGADVRPHDSRTLQCITFDR
jgi:hypothetical protein